MNRTIHRLKSVLGITVFMGLLAAGCGAQTNTTSQSSQNSVNQNTSNSATASSQTVSAPVTTMHWSSPPKMQIDLHKQYTAIFHTNFGDFKVQLFTKESPVTVNNFVFLANHHFYENDTFFRIIQTFMIQTGDPNNSGTGGPGYKFKDELPVKHPYGPGIVAMANAGSNTNGSQFFICTGQDSVSLNKNPNYTEFGKVISGMNVVQKIAAIPVTTNPQTGEPSSPLQKAYIKSITIVMQ